MCSMLIHLNCVYCRGDRVHCTLWDEFTERMHRFLDGHDSSLPVVIILQQCKLKKFLGKKPLRSSH
jgi:hypothetical protein